MRKVAYVFTCWFGARRAPDSRALQAPSALRDRSGFPVADYSPWYSTLYDDGGVFTVVPPESNKPPLFYPMRKIVAL